MPEKKLKEFLDKNKIKYISIKHSPAFTSQEIAQSAHISGKNFAKTVIIKADNKIAMAVLPAKQLLDIDKLKELMGAEYVAFASETEFEKLFPGCEVGAMPPFGNIYNMDVYASKELTKDDEIAFNAGTHTEVVKLAYRDFEKLVKPKIAQLSVD
jgi:Ala-tRNA(Pro) deacylase